MFFAAKGITKKYGDKTIIKDINITLDKNQTLSLLGVSGVGKTTLFNVLAGLQSPNEGDIFLEDNCITSQTGTLSYMQQKDLLLPFKSILNNVIIPLTLNGTKKVAARKQAIKYFDRFGLTGCEDFYPSQLSGGMRQRAAFLRTFLFSSKLMLLDEPFSALDTFTKNKLHVWYLDIIKKLDITTILITHDIDEAIFLSNKIYIMGNTPGEITNEITIKRPEDIKEFEFTKEFIDYKHQVYDCIGNV